MPVEPVEPAKPVVPVDDLEALLEHAMALADDLSMPMVAVFINHAIENLDAARKFKRR